jgi:hydroxypyruvate reductase
MTETSELDRRRFLRAMYDAAIAAADPAHCLPRHLPPPPTTGRLVFVGAGKAAAAMAEAASLHYRAAGQARSVTGAVVTRHGAGRPADLIAIDEAGHPVPDAASEAAARRALALVRAAHGSDGVVCLLSGGASALWAAPVAGVDLGAKQQLTRDLLRVGARISEVNCVRRHLSAIKGGRLAAASAAPVLTLAISDVPGDDPAVIGSGPTVADPTTLADARAVLSRYGLHPSADIAAALEDPANETVKPRDAALVSADFRLIATPKAALAAAGEVARAQGCEVVDLGDALEGEARDIAARHAELARGARRADRRVVILSGGELTVTVRGAGRGGPNQEYALALALALQGERDIHALAADTDGIDGGGGDPADPAGAIVAPDTLARAAKLPCDPAICLSDNDSTGFFSALGDLVQCGPTGTNVNDFRAIVVDP